MAMERILTKASIWHNEYFEEDYFFIVDDGLEEEETRGSVAKIWL